MKKGFKYYAGIWAIFLAIFNIAVFASPSEAAGMNKFGGAFLVGYIFITIAFIGQLAVSYLAFKAENIQKFFYKISLIQISRAGLILTLIFGTLCMVIPNLPNWIGIIACFTILALYAVSLVKATAAADIVSEIDDKIKSKTEFIKMLTADAEHLMTTAKSDEIKAESKKVYEALRYSDPVSNTALVETEMKIEKRFADFTVAVNDENTANATAIGAEIISLIDLRNKKCKLLK